jgi:hypothetical protein
MDGHTDRSSRSGTHDAASHSEGEGWPKYARFVAMIATSVVVMYVLTYTNVFALDHVRFSEERLYMALLMGAAMALVMLAFMWSMYRSPRAKAGIIVGAFVLGAVAFFLSQSQLLVDEQAYMKGMIPHHSIAILTSERAAIEDVRVRDLADSIIEAQRREIAEMDWLIADIEANGPAIDEAQALARPVPSFAASASAAR